MVALARRLREIAAVLPPIASLRRQRDQFATRARDLETELNAAREELDSLLRAEAERRAADEPYRLFPPGHFYSPQPDLDHVRSATPRLFDRSREVTGVDVRLAAQADLLDEIAPLIATWPYAEPDADSALRFRPDNDYFGWTDSQIWYGLLQLWNPGRVVEIGCGWSSAMLLDTVERFDLQTEIVLVEPFPERLSSVLRDGDADRVELVERPVQDVAVDLLTGVEAGDVLFIDSTHVSKVGSDVNFLFFEVLPRLRPGVHVHVHDIAYPFEYPREWVLEGRAWNEAYLLRAFLTGNPHWQIDLWPSVLQLRHRELMAATLHARTPVDGGSLWLHSC